MLLMTTTNETLPSRPGYDVIPPEPDNREVRELRARVAGLEVLNASLREENEQLRRAALPQSPPEADLGLKAAVDNELAAAQALSTLFASENDVRGEFLCKRWTCSNRVHDEGERCGACAGEEGE